MVSFILLTLPLMTGVAVGLSETDTNTLSKTTLSSGIISGAAFPRPVLRGVDKFNFGAHAVDQCDQPIKDITNIRKSTRFGARRPDGSCAREICIGDCVRIRITGSGSLGLSRPVNIIVGQDLPDPVTNPNFKDCSDVAIDTNDPPGSWDFSHAGNCGKGDAGEGVFINCLVHDVCVWARCTDDSLVAGGFGFNFNPFKPQITGGIQDKKCGESFAHAVFDFIEANALGCAADSNCLPGQYCQLLRCRDGSLGDPCRKTAECQGELVCTSKLILGKTCQSPSVLKEEGRSCLSDAECKGYCEALKCFDGTEGDRCSKPSDCQSPLTCRGVPGFEKCTRKKGEGAACTNDNQCLGYCQLLKCYDGSKGDRCGKNSDCQSGKCKFKMFKGRRCS